MFYIGIVEDRIDPLDLGRCKVRVVGVHTHDKNLLKTADLPWAHPMGPITSAGISGKGDSPTGLVEGSSVVIIFTDEDQQQPIMLGTVGGIPQGAGRIDVESDDLLQKNEDGDVETQSGTIVSTGIAGQPAIFYSASPSALSLIKKEEKLSKKAYLDSNGKWTIGYGVSSIDGSPVYEGQIIDEATADRSFLAYVNSVATPDVQKAVKVPITQSMFDALVSFAYNLGGPKFRKSSVLAQLNAGEYLQAAAELTTYNKDVNGNKLAALVARRENEKALFLKDGIPGPDSVIQPVFADVDNQTTNNGFSDPNGKYPLFLNEPDTNRLARHDLIEKTIVRKKELARERNVLTAGGITWTQSPIPYNTTYPFNHVYESESGHVMEFDDTPHSERVHIYHKAGTFWEVDANGTDVKRIVGDKYEIIDRNGHLYIKGNENITIDGECNVRINNAINIEIVGDATIKVFNDANIYVSGSADLSVKESFKLKADSVSIETNSYSLMTGTKTETMSGDASVTYNGDLHTMIGADTYNRHNSGTDFSCPSDPSRSGDVDCSSVDEAGSTGLVIPAARGTVESVDRSPLNVVTRGLSAAQHYETPEEGDPTLYINKQIVKGTIDPYDEDTTEKQEQIAPSKNTVKTPPKSCDLIFATDAFDGSYQLSQRFNLGSLTKNFTVKPIDQAGLSKQQIVCNLKGLAENCLDKIFEMYPNMIITSGLRRIGVPKEASPNSQHNKGQAADIQFPGFTAQQYYDAIQEIQKVVPYDQLILEYKLDGTAWIHVSFSYDGGRRQHFTMKNHHHVGKMGEFLLIA